VVVDCVPTSVPVLYIVVCDFDYFTGLVNPFGKLAMVIMFGIVPYGDLLPFLRVCCSATASQGLICEK
jgi:hypothetical protein